MRTAFLVSGGVLSGCVAIWSLEGDQTARVASHLGFYGMAFAAYLASLHVALSGRLPRQGLRLALGVSLLWRLMLVMAPPLLSDDVYRYVWEGRIQLHGGNPFAWSDRPQAGKWAPLRDEVWAGVNHKDYAAIYPPLWQIAARGVVAVHDSVTAMKAFLVLCEVLTLWVLAGLLRRRGLPPERLLVLAWSPLALVEIAGSGHNEPFGMLFLVLSLWALEAGRPLVSAVAAALGLQAKFLPGLVAVAWSRRYRPGDALAALALAALLVVPYADAGAGLWRSLGEYGRRWRFNETLFAPLAFAVGHVASVRALVLAVVGVASLLAWRRAEPAGSALVVIIAWLLLAPNVLPWYALWLLPLLALRDEPAALLFTGTVGLAYLVYPGWLSGGPWHLDWGIRALEYGPCVAVGLWSGFERRPVAASAGGRLGP